LVEGMNTEYELTALRSIREINIAIRDLENQQAAVTKRYKRGIKMLGKLIADPQLDNIEDDNVV
jgi:hypothetical protein